MTTQQQQMVKNYRIIDSYGIYAIPIRFENQQTNTTIECWLPLTNKEPANKKNKTGNNLTLRKTQPDRGGYYGTNQGDSLHVAVYKKAGLWKDDSSWEYHVSHLCHHWWCCNPYHMIKEPDWVNIFRKNCKAAVNGSKGCDCYKVSHDRLTNNLARCLWYPASTLSNVNINFLDEDFLKETLKKNIHRFLGDFNTLYKQIKSVVGNG